MNDQLDETADQCSLNNEKSIQMTKTVTDNDLLVLLRENARLSTAEIGRRLGLARSTVQSRLERLERSGVIRGYRVELGPSAAVRQVQAHAMVGVEPAQQVAVERRLRALPAVTALYSVSGPYDLVAMLAAESTEALDMALDQVRSTPGVKGTTTSVILSRRFER
jgi:DNA-binding Lrp family transcriptional regulator